MGEPADLNEVEKILSTLDTDTFKDNPLPITYGVIYDALVDIFPGHALTIIHSLNRVVVIEKDCPQFSTMGVTADGTLFISRKFWDTHMLNSDALKTVLMHEMMHCIAGDSFTLKTPEDGDDWELQNMADLIAMDSRINAYICNSRPDLYPQDFLVKFYGEELVKAEPLQRLLRPGSSFDPYVEEDNKVFPYYQKFYKSEEFCSHSDLAKEILEILKTRPSDGKGGKKLKLKLLGAHGKGGKELTDEDLEGVESIEIDSSELTEEDMKNPNEGDDGVDTTAGTELPDKIKEAVAEHLKEQSCNGAGKGNKSAQYLIKLSDQVTEKFDVNKFKKMFVDNVFHNVRAQARKRIGNYATSPLIPIRLATTDLLMAAQGYPVMLWKTKKWQYTIDNNMLPIYLDVSGSTRPHLPEIIKLITNVSSELTYVWGFSNRVEKHTTEELKQGITKGTGGTDFDCVIDHALENNYKHIVVISDGDAYTRREGRQNYYDDSNVTSNTIPEIASVVTVLFGYANKNNYFSRAYGNTHMIDEVTV